MLIGQSLLAPADGTHTVYGPWSPRRGDKFTAVVEVIRTSNISGAPLWRLRTKQVVQLHAFQRPLPS